MKRFLVHHCNTRRAREAIVVFKATDASAVRRVVEDGRSYVVVPLVLMTEGVRQAANAEAPEFVGAAEIEASAAAWNGQPVTLDHPKRGGQYVSAHRADAVEVIGEIRNAEGRDGKLVAEAWVDVAAVDRLATMAQADLAAEAKALVGRIEAGEEIEVSAGYFVEVVAESGSHDGIDYAGVQHGIDPDHAALLRSTQRGACSWHDGCGAPRMSKALRARTNADSARTPVFVDIETTDWATVDRSFQAYAKAFLTSTNSARTSVPSSVADAPAAMKRWIADRTLAGNEQTSRAADLVAFPVVNPTTGRLNEAALRAATKGSNRAVVGAARALLGRYFGAGLREHTCACQVLEVSAVSDADLRTSLGMALDDAYPDRWAMVVAVYADYFVFQLGGDLMKLGFSAAEDGAVTLADTGTAMRVRPVTDFLEVSTGLTKTDVTGETKTSEAPKAHEEQTMTDEEKKAADDAAAKATSDKQAADALGAKKAADTEAERVALAAAAAKNQSVTLEQLLANADPATRESIAIGARLYKDRRVALVKQLVAASAGVLTEEKLNARSFDELTELARFAAAVAPKTVNEQPNFAGLGLPAFSANESDDDGDFAKAPEAAIKVGSRPELLRRGAATK